MSLYPTLDCNMASDSMNVNYDRHASPEPCDDIEIVLQIPPENINIKFVHSDNQINELSVPVSIMNEYPFPSLEFGDHKIALNETVFCLHNELESFVFGGRDGPVDGTDYHIVLTLNNTPDDVLISLTCIFMSNCTYKNLFVDDTPFQQKDIGKFQAFAFDF
jgi:hypothetical protein